MRNIESRAQAERLVREALARRGLRLTEEGIEHLTNFVWETPNYAEDVNAYVNCFITRVGANQYIENKAQIEEAKRRGVRAWTREEIKAMSLEEYLRHREEILKAQQLGLIQ